MIKVSSQRDWRLESTPHGGASFRIGDRTFSIADAEDGPERFGQPMTVLTTIGHCVVCGRAYTFEATKSCLSPIQICVAYRLSRKPFWSRPKQTVPSPKLQGPCGRSALKPQPKFPMLSVSKKGERLPYLVGDRTVAKVSPFGTAEVAFNDDIYDVVPYRKLRRGR